MATPFLHVGDPQFNTQAAVHSMKGAFIIAAAVTMVIVLGGLIAIGELFSDWLSLVGSSLIGGVILLVLSVSLLFAVPRLLAAPFLIGEFASARLVDRYTRLGQNLVLQKHLGLPVLILRTTGDEASAALAISQFLSWLIGRLAAPMASLEPIARSCFGTTQIDLALESSVSPGL
jgi:hypothetical protein